jgi:hypothetical protein
MEHVLDLYQQEADPKRPLICFDEKPMQVVGSLREEVPMRPGRSRKIDYEYERHGTCNLFMFFAPLLGRRHVVLSQRRRKVDFAEAMREVIDGYFPKAESIRLVCDNLNTHVAGSFYERYAPQKARWLARVVEFHYTPKNASWLKMAEIELAAFEKQCLDRRWSGDGQEALPKEIAALEEVRNRKGIDVDWRFTTGDARNKMRRLYPQIDL